MKPNTKKLLIIAFAVMAIAIIVWLLFFRKKGYEKVIDSLAIGEDDKKALKQQVKAIVSDSAFNKAYYEAAAARNKITYDQYLVLEAAYYLGWTAGITNGIIDVRPID